MDEDANFDEALSSGDVGWHVDDGRFPDTEPYIPDDVSLVVETANMVSVFAAERYQRIDGLRVRALADAARYGDAIAPVIERSVRLELSAALRVGETVAGGMMAVAEALVHRYPTVLDALGHAQITDDHARALVAGVEVLEPALAEKIVPPALAIAEETTVAAFRRALTTLIETERAQTLAERHAEALTSRRTAVENVGDGMAWFHAYLPAVEAHAIYGRITTIAKTITRQPGEDRTLDQVRADVFADLLIDGDTGCLPPTARGIRPTVVVTVPALSVLSGEGAEGGDPAVVEGVGPIPLERARELCGQARDWIRVLTHPETGMVLSVGRDRYDPPKMIRDLVTWRADRCMGPGCGMPASRCEIDHTLAWVDGGSTSLANLAPLCKGHHTIKHHGGWRIRQVPGSGGAIEWTSPSGRQYVVKPERRVPAFRPADAGDAPF
ncbi:HNH endonuclease signature motif containing protein [Microbacterium thalassium]|uniref:HNH nuclease domain-containing protein n=1 Tax=Microbacterium thalassium TaxID=362649 RepID=A0A7X0KV88_9MICO|nr:HNH endonuclease signature motif containing protein [Microbacterium thalassium]MBB6391982.1 hypothetical protein [Microbacterium thalassium]GLK24002.1 hypothetical protein GCM10017607_13200 [Microbacterium thalassium]